MNGIGVDLTHISRFRNKSDSFAQKILSPQEYNEYSNSNKKDYFLATRWAIKEAIFKADNSLFEFKKINIEKRDNKYVYEGFEISISHDQDVLVAFVIRR